VLVVDKRFNRSCRKELYLSPGFRDLATWEGGRPLHLNTGASRIVDTAQNSLKYGHACIYAFFTVDNMGTPHHIPQPPSRHFPRDTASAEYKALTLITHSLAHPHRSILSSFIQQAACKEGASQFFLDRALGQGEAGVREFLADWVSLLKKGLLLRDNVDRF
jgi:hypothetical protein